MSSRYDPLKAGAGEDGMPRDDEEIISTLLGTASSVRKRSPQRKTKIRKDGKSGDGGINESIMAIVELLKTKNEEKMPFAVKKSRIITSRSEFYL